MRPLHLVLTAALAAAYTTDTLAQQAPAPAPAIPTSPTADVAAPAPAVAATEVPSPYDRIWNRFSQVYRKDMNPAIQQVLFTGRFQHDFVMLDADEGEHEESNIRRVRLEIGRASCRERV